MFQEYFYSLSKFLQHSSKPGEVLLWNYDAESSDFIRFNQGKIRQPGSVTQHYITLDLIFQKKQISYNLGLSGLIQQDKSALETALSTLRNKVAHIPEDPYILYEQTPNTSSSKAEGSLPKPEEAVSAIVEASSGLDLIGIYAQGGIFRGFGNSMGQTNYHESTNFNFDFSAYLRDDKAAKSNYSGTHFDAKQLTAKIRTLKEALPALNKKPKDLSPGHYRAYFSPGALGEILDLITWGGFSYKEMATKQSSLLKMHEEDLRLSDKITLSENTCDGIAPNFQSEGFLKPHTVPLIENGKLTNSLVSPRTAREYNIEHNGADGGEGPQSLDLAPGTLKNSDILSALGTGLYINNLWYLNYSDRSSCRMTGMTRFATFWVENGEIVAPLNVMRFDDTLFHMLGSKLENLTQERETLVDASTYDARASSSMTLPGAVIDGFTLTL